VTGCAVCMRSTGGGVAAVLGKNNSGHRRFSQIPDIFYAANSECQRSYHKGEDLTTKTHALKLLAFKSNKQTSSGMCSESTNKRLCSCYHVTVIVPTGDYFQRKFFDRATSQNFKSTRIYPGVTQGVSVSASVSGILNLTNDRGVSPAFVLVSGSSHEH
jgi:hypothetical protein